MTTISQLYPRLTADDAAQTLYYRLQDDESVGFTFYDPDAPAIWEVFPAPGGWAVRKCDLRTLLVSRTHGGFHPGAVISTLECWGLPAGAVWSPTSQPDIADRESVVYLVGSPDSRLVKIGRSDDVQRRLNDIQRMSPVPLTVLWTTRGGADLEARLHRRFAGHRVYGEWFDFGDNDPIETVRKEIRK